MAKTKESDKQSDPTKTNLTIKIDKDLLRKVRVVAAEEGVSISALFSDLIQEKYSKTKSYEAAMKRAIALMNSGIELNWEKPLSRDEMHERR
jgi:Family of unknown function (DUF6364)